MVDVDLAFFVYGTLKPGEVNYRALCAGRTLTETPAQVRGTLFLLPGWGYPAIAPGDTWVQGYVLTFGDRAILAMLDHLEDYQPDRPATANAYQRQWSPVWDRQGSPLGQAWTYWMTPQHITQRGGVPLPSGCWSP